jgi:hypothetical protein
MIGRIRHSWAAWSKRRKLLTAGAAVAVIGVTGGIAAALWGATGTGSGRARSTSAVALTVTASDGAQDLYPGFTQGDVFFTITNPNPYGVTFTSMTPGTVTSSDTTGCPSANVTVVAATGLSLVVPANATSPQLSIPNVVTMLAGAPDGCQNVSFNIALTLSGAQT